MKALLLKPKPKSTFGKPLPIQNLVDFQLRDDHIECKDAKFYFYR